MIASYKLIIITNTHMGSCISCAQLIWGHGKNGQ